MKEPKPNRIGEVRKYRGLSQQGLAELLDSHLVTISKLENGKMKLTDEWIARIASALSVDPNDLVVDPSPKKLVYIKGKIDSDAMVRPFTEEQAKKRAPVEVDMNLSSIGQSFWFIVEGDGLYPLFKNGDLLRLTEIEFNSYYMSEVIDHLCSVRTVRDGDTEIYIAVPTHYHADDMFDLHLLNGPPLRYVKVQAVALVTMAIFASEFSKKLKARRQGKRVPSPEWLKFTDLAKKPLT